MVPRAFEYFAPESVAEATRLLSEHRGEAKLLAGGMSLIPLMKLRLASPSYIVDINNVAGLDFIQMSEDGGSLMIGALTRHHSLESSPLVRADFPIISEAVSMIGDPQVRNMGTIGGALAHSDPSGDLGAVMLALRATITAVGPGGERTIPIDEFLVDTFATSLREDEMITRVSVPTPSERASSGAYMKFERKAGDFATVGVAAQLGIGQGRDGGVCTYAGVGLTALGPKSLRSTKAEARLVGNRLDEKAIEEAASAAASECSPTDDPLRGSADYKREMASVFTKRALERAADRANARGRGHR
jgi:carbon-monoxide dehydrogenase medium subunit